MNYKKILCGNNPPEDLYAIIEISYNSSLIKYEINKENNVLFVDRFINTPVFYPFNYGYINNTLSNDNDNLDILVITSNSILPGSVINVRPVGLLKMKDECGDDNKIISIPNYNITKEYDSIQDIFDISKNTLDKILYFFQNYKSLESNKWTEVFGWEDINIAKQEILNCILNFKKNKIIE